jgi:glutamine synthetase
VEELLARRAALGEVVGDAEPSHDDLAGQAMRLTTDGAARMAELREICDRLERVVADEHWPLPKYREMLFPV